MAFESRIRPRELWVKVVNAVVAFGLGGWGAYDYWERIPRQEAEFKEYQSATEQVRRYADMSVPGQPRLTPEQEAEYQLARATVDKYASGAPTPVAFYDRPLQLWIYTIGCGILWTGWAVVSLARTAPRTFRLDDDGTLHTRDRAITRDEVVDVDMSRWMAKSIATLKVRSGAPVVLDDFKFGGMHLIVGAYAHRFMPERWNPDATLVKKGSESAKGASAGGSSQSGGASDPVGGSAAGQTPPRDAAQDRIPSA